MSFIRSDRSTLLQPVVIKNRPRNTSRRIIVNLPGNLKVSCPRGTEFLLHQRRGFGFIEFFLIHTGGQLCLVRTR